MGNVYNEFLRRGISRREFLKFCSAISVTLALPTKFVTKIAEALQKKEKPYLIWLEFQDCTGNTESLLRASKPSVNELLLDILSVEYHDTIMAAAGQQAEDVLMNVVKKQKGKYIVAVEGAIPLKDGGIYCCIGGKKAKDIIKEVCSDAIVTLAVGSCAAYGGLPAAEPNPTGAVGVKDILKDTKVVNLPGCPVNVENITATIVHFLTFDSLPLLDNLGRPLFAYGKRIHDNCERRSYFDAGQFVHIWGDKGHREGWCLYKMGCKGPETFKNCPKVKYNEGVNWPVGAGHGCIGCSEPEFWDKMSPFYRRLPHAPGFGVEKTADSIGAGIAVATTGAIVAHGIGRFISKRTKSKEVSHENSN